MNTRSARITRLRPERPPATRASDRAARNLAYRRLVTTILGLDVATLAAELDTGPRVNVAPSRSGTRGT